MVHKCLRQNSENVPVLETLEQKHAILKTFLKAITSYEIMPRGRPVGSGIRQNIVEILYFLEKGYGYDIYRAYRELFTPVTMRSIYYHLRKGLQTNEFEVAEVRQEQGEYSWGAVVTKTYYKLGKAAKPTIKPEVKAYFDKK